MFPTPRGANLYYSCVVAPDSRLQTRPPSLCVGRGQGAPPPASPQRQLFIVVFRKGCLTKSSERSQTVGQAGHDKPHSAAVCFSSAVISLGGGGVICQATPAGPYRSITDYKGDKWTS